MPTNPVFYVFNAFLNPAGCGEEIHWPALADHCVMLVMKFVQRARSLKEGHRSIHPEYEPWMRDSA